MKRTEKKVSLLHHSQPVALGTHDTDMKSLKRNRLSFQFHALRERERERERE